MERSLLRDCFLMCDFITQSSTLPFLEQFANSAVFSKVIFGSSLWAMVKKEITLDQNWKEAFWETAFRCVNATHTVTRLSSVFSLLTQFSLNLQWDTSEHNETNGDKGSILRWKLEGSFVRNFLVMSEFISQSYTYVSCSSPLSVFLRNLRRTSLNRIEPAVIKEMSSVQIVKEAFWETSFCSLNSSPRVTA